MNYKIDINKMVVELIPTFLRKKRQIKWLWALSHPLKSLYVFFERFRKNIAYRLSHNSQVCYLEAALSDVFDLEKRRIYISNGLEHSPQYIYTALEQKDRYLGTVYLRDKSVYLGQGIDFIVWLPPDMLLTTEERYAMEGLIDYYKLAGRRYKIKNV